jgi:DNA-directed RNA polymerase subunit F
MRGYMPAFIKLRDEDGTEVAINVAMITKIVPGSADELTSVYLVDEEDPLEVQESIDEVLSRVKAAS